MTDEAIFPTEDTRMEEESYTLQQLGLQFESLGGGGLRDSGWAFGCEFGFFQRDVCDVDPLGFLRWASIPPSDLIVMLRSKLEGLIRQENLHVYAHAGTWHLRIIADGVNTKIDHKNLNVENITKAEATGKLEIKDKFLAKKLLDDLHLGEKIFVYRTIDHGISDETLIDLAEEANSFGKNILLYVQEADEKNLPFTVKMIHPGLIRGYIDYFAPKESGLVFNNMGWEKICRAALTGCGNSTSQTQRRKKANRDRPIHERIFRWTGARRLNLTPTAG